jgi:hypothetical protein
MQNDEIIVFFFFYKPIHCRIESQRLLMNIDRDKGVLTVNATAEANTGWFLLHLAANYSTQR